MVEVAMMVVARMVAIGKVYKIVVIEVVVMVMVTTTIKRWSYGYWNDHGKMVMPT